MYACKCGLRWVSRHDRKTNNKEFIRCLCGRRIIAWNGTFVYTLDKGTAAPSHGTSQMRLPPLKM